MHRLTLLRAAILGAVLAAGPSPACRIIPIPPPWPPPWPHPPVPAPPPRPEPRPIETRSHRAEIEIGDGIARVDVEAVFRNPNGFRLEGTYFFPIEPGAVVSDFTLTVDGKELKAELLEADKAREQYEAIVRRMKDPGLLEFMGTRMLKARVYPMEPNADVKVALRYTQAVRSDAGLFHFRYPLRSARPEAGRIAQLALRAKVRSDTPVKLFYSPTHPVDVVRHGDREAVGGFEAADTLPERDFDLYWSLDRADVGVSAASYRPPGEDGYVLLAIAPDVSVDDRRVEPKDIVFAFDKSGSMAGDKLRQAKEALVYCLDRLHRDDRFGVLAFSTDVDALTDGLAAVTPETVGAAKARVEALEARGGTAIHDALEQALGLAAADGERLAMVVFLTDGKPTVGPADADEILAAAAKANTGKARVFAFGVGYDLNTDLLDRLATDNGGTQQYVGEQEDIEVKVSSFYEKIAQPVLSGVAVEAQGVELRDVYPRRTPDVFAGGQVLLFGRYRGGGRGTVTVRGKAQGREQTFTCEADFDGNDRHRFLPPLWAHRKVAFLLEEIRLRGRNRELEEEVVALGKRYGILTPYTSFLATEDETPERRERVLAMRRSFETVVSGRGGVGLSRNLAEAKAADAALPGAAPATLGFGWSPGAAPAGPEAGPEVSGFAQRIRRVADKVFYLEADGFYYDAAFEESMRPRIVEIARMGDAYFELLGRHAGIGPYLAADLKMVLCMDGRVYRITE